MDECLGMILKNDLDICKSTRMLPVLMSFLMDCIYNFEVMPLCCTFHVAVQLESRLQAGYLDTICMMF